MKLVFPASSEDLSDAFNNAIAQGVMERENQDDPKFWAKYELVASDGEDGVVVADWFFHKLADRYTRVSRKESSK